MNGPCLGRGGGKVVSVLAFYSDDPSSNPAKVYSFFCNIVFEMNEKRPGLAHFKKIEAVNGPLKIFFSAAPLKMHQN